MSHAVDGGVAWLTSLMTTVWGHGEPRRERRALYLTPSVAGDGGRTSASLTGMSMARARFGRRRSAVGMAAIRDCALGRRSARDPGVHQIRATRASERAAREAFAARRALARARCSAWDGGRSGRACSRKGQNSLHRGSGESSEPFHEVLTCNSQAPWTCVPHMRHGPKAQWRSSCRSEAERGAAGKQQARRDTGARDG